MSNIDVQLSGGVVVGAVETDVLTLAAYHPLVDAYVDSLGDPKAQATQWRLYTVNTGAGGSTFRTLIGFATPKNIDAAVSERILEALPGGGVSMVLTAQSSAGNVTLKAALVGYDRQSNAEPDAVQNVDGTHALTTNYAVVCTNPTWRPRCDLYVNGSQASELPSEWQICASFAGMAPAPLAYAVQSSVNQKIALDTPAGCSAYVARGRSSTPSGIATTVVLNAENPTAGTPILSGGGLTPITQTDWFVDPIQGNDNTGDGTVGAPYATFARLAKQWGRGAVLGVGSLLPPANTFRMTTIHVLASTPNNDPLTLDVTLANQTGLRVVGESFTQAYAGNFSAVTPLDRPSNVPWDVTDPGIPTTWTALFGKRIRITQAGARAGAVFYPAKDLGAKQARVSAPLLSDPSAFQFGGPSGTIGGPAVGNLSRVTPLVGDAYVVEDCVNITLGRIRLSTNGNGSTTTGGAPIQFQDLTFASPAESFGGLPVQADTSCSVTYLRCRFPALDGNSTVGNHYFFNCQWPDQFARLPSNAQNAVAVFGGLMTGMVVANGGSTLLDWDLLFQGSANHSGKLAIAGGAVVYGGSVGYFDAAAGDGFGGYGISIGVGQIAGGSGVGGAYLENASASGQSGTYGAGAALMGVFLGIGSKFGYGTIPTITGLGGNISLGAGVTTAMALRADTGAAIGPLALTWANIAGAYPGGFANNAQLLTRGVVIAQVA